MFFPSLAPFRASCASEVLSAVPIASRALYSSVGVTRSMYAVIETGGKQYRVRPGQTVEVELLPAEPGATVTLERVLLVSNDGNTLVGQPTVAGAAVVGTITREGRGKKIIVFKYKSKKRYRRTQGHRQDYTYLTITDIQAEGKSLVSDEERRVFERQATRAAERYQARLMGDLVDDLAFDEAVGDDAAVEDDEEAIENAKPSKSDRAKK
jgi:large subunit ribosomal protein L21